MISPGSEGNPDMAEPAPTPPPSKTAAKLLVLFIPSVDRNQKSVAQGFWLE